MDSRRAEAFSDGVFAVAITILVFGLLDIGSGTLSAQVLLHAWPHYFAYVVSFLTIGIMWMNHHTILGHVTRVDRPLLVLNLLLLLVIVAMSAGFTAIWVYVVTHAPSLGAAVPQGPLRRSIPGFTLGGAAYVAATLIALWSPVAALILYLLLAVYYLFEHLPGPAEGPAAG